MLGQAVNITGQYTPWVLIMTWVMCELSSAVGSNLLKLLSNIK
jgi:hypothetical protein